MPASKLPLQVLPLDYDRTDPASIERYAKRLIGRTLREAVKADLHVEVSRGKGGLGQDLELLYFKLPRNNASRPDFAEAGLELKCSPVKRLKDGRLVPKERVSLSMIDYAHILEEEWETSAFLKKNRHLLLVFYLFDEHITSPLDYTIKYVGRWSIPDECMPLLRDDWLYIQKMVGLYGPGVLSGRLTQHLEAAKKGALGINANRAFALKPAFVGKYVLPLLRTQPILPQHLDASSLAVQAAKIREMFAPFAGLTASEIGQRLELKFNPAAKNFHAAATKAILGVDPDNAIEDVTVRSVRLEYGRSVPRESVSFPYFDYFDLLQQRWEVSEPFLFVVYRQESPRGPYVLDDVRLWLMPDGDLDGEVRRVWMETVARIRGGSAGDLPRQVDSPIAHVRPHGRDSHDTLPTPKNGQVVKKSFWLNRGYIGGVIA